MRGTYFLFLDSPVTVPLTSASLHTLSALL
jgi:hypothetical protein